MSDREREAFYKGVAYCAEFNRQIGHVHPAPTKETVVASAMRLFPDAPTTDVLAPLETERVETPLAKNLCLLALRERDALCALLLDLEVKRLIHGPMVNVDDLLFHARARIAQIRSTNG